MDEQPFDAAQTVTRLLMVLVPMVFAYSVHEFAHAYVATKLGDPTPEEDGRLTLDPRAHVDPMGTLVFPALSVLGGGLPMLGWAKPTFFRADRFTVKIPPRVGVALVSVAGPLSNLLFGFVSAIALVALQLYAYRAADASPDPRSLAVATTVLALRLVQMNALLTVFNLLPIPPLDGSRLMPKALDPFFATHGRYLFPLLFLGIAFVPAVSNFVLGRPVAFVERALLKSAAAIVLPIAQRFFT